MIILIGGSSHVGKTYFAQKLLERLSFPYLSLDHLKMGFIRTNRTSLTVEDDEEMRGFLWPFAAEIIKTALENRQNLIVEGCYIPENWKNSFTETDLNEIRSVFIVMSEAYLRSRFDDVCRYADVIEHRLCDDPNLDRLILCSQEFRESCMRNHTPLVEIDSEFDPDVILIELLQILGLCSDHHPEHTEICLS